VGTLGEALFSGVLFWLGILSLTSLIVSQTMSATPLYGPGFGFWVLILVLSSFIVLGAGGVILTVFHVGTSAERRIALARRAANLNPRGQSAGPRRLPNIPSDANLTNSPGVKLKYRLPVIQSAAWRLVFATVFCLIWNGSAAVLLVFAINSFLDERPEWFLRLFTVPFLAIGGWAIYDFVRQMLIHTGIGPTHVEISEHPWYPGGTYRVYLSQGGHLNMSTLALRLVCEEMATYRQGTNIRTEIKAVFDRQIFRKTNFHIEPGIPFEHTCSVEIPFDAMHSFQSEHNAINWKLLVRGEAEGWPPYERCFPVIVHPCHGHDQTSN
jgi:hypothetical protein